jgi:hypothetical protein
VRLRRSSRPVTAIVMRLISWLGVLAVIALSVDQIVRLGDFRVDDTYITFSFSKNVALGNGAVYSHGLRVEGYSNFLWMLIVAPAFWVAPDSDGYTWSRVAGALLLAFGLFLSYKLARRAAGRITALLAPLAIITCTDVMRATLSGLETIPFAVAILFGWWVYLREAPNRRRWSLLAFLPAALMRIDGFVPLLIVAGFEVLHAVHERRFSLRRLLVWAAPAVGLWTLYFAWRWSYYGLPLPTTYYAKELVASQDPGRGYNQIWAFLRDYGVLALLPITLLPLVRGPRRDAAALWTAVVLQFSYAGMTGGDWMPFHRFLLPVVPLAAVLAAWGAARVADEVRGFRWVTRAGAIALTGAAFLFFGVHAHMASVDTVQERQKLGEAAHVKKHTNENLRPGMDLAKYIIRKPGEKLVTDYAGVFAVFTEAHIIDMWGLCNADIALKGDASGINAIYGKTCIACYAELAPDYFHVNVPLVRSPRAFHSMSQVLSQVFQGDAIDGVIDIRHNFAAGRVVELRTDRALWFLERRRGMPLVPRTPAAGIRVDYPFEPGH